MHIAAEHLSKVFQHRDRTIRAIDDVSFTVGHGEFVCVVGSSGCGKTTLLKLMAGLLSPSSGQVRVDEQPDDGRPATALVFQENGLLPWMTVIENVALGLRLRGCAHRERRQRAAVQLAQVGLAAFAESYPHQLSAGMRQRVNIARALLVDPHVLLMDEPFAALDALTKLALQEELVKLWAARRWSVLFVTHDIDEAVRLGDRVLVMTGGRGGHGRIHEDIRVPLARPRDLVSRATPEVVELARHIWTVLEDEVRRPLSMTP